MQKLIFEENILTSFVSLTVFTLQVARARVIHTYQFPTLLRGKCRTVTEKHNAKLNLVYA